jgi:hypothetical protein
MSEDVIFIFLSLAHFIQHDDLLLHPINDIILFLEKEFIKLFKYAAKLPPDIFTRLCQSESLYFQMDITGEQNVQ